MTIRGHETRGLFDCYHTLDEAGVREPLRRLQTAESDGANSVKAGS